MNKDLKPCPFCGGQAALADIHPHDYGPPREHIYCTVCRVSAPNQEAWNKRV